MSDLEFRPFESYSSGMFIRKFINSNNNQKDVTSNNIYGISIINPIEMLIAKVKHSVVVYGNLEFYRNRLNTYLNYPNIGDSLDIITNGWEGTYEVNLIINATFQAASDFIKNFKDIHQRCNIWFCEGSIMYNRYKTGFIIGDASHCLFTISDVEYIKSYDDSKRAKKMIGLLQELELFGMREPIYLEEDFFDKKAGFSLLKPDNIF